MNELIKMDIDYILEYYKDDYEIIKNAYCYDEQLFFLRLNEIMNIDCSVEDKDFLFILYCSRTSNRYIEIKDIEEELRNAENEYFKCVDENSKYYLNIVNGLKYKLDMCKNHKHL